MHPKFHPMLVLFISALCLMAPSQLASAQTAVIRVPGDFSTIQEAINAASPGSVILVNAGVYNEHIVVNKTLKLIGVNRACTIIDGKGDGALITVEADDVSIDGFTMRNSSRGIHLHQIRNSKVSGNTITASKYGGIFLNHSDNSVIQDNLVTLTGDMRLYPLIGLGICLLNSSNNSIAGNMIVECFGDGVNLIFSSNNTIRANAIADQNNFGISFLQSGNNTIYHNSFINNACQVNNATYNNASRNYWDDYAGLDDGSNGRDAGDGIGDTDLPHAFGGDYYPLVRPPEPIPIIWENTPYRIAFVANSTILAFRFMQTEKKVAFIVRGPSNTTGFCKVTIPKNILRDSPWRITLNNTDVTPQASITQNQTHTFIHFTYNHSMHHVEIIGTWVVPETPTIPMLIVMMLILTFILALLRKKAGRSTQALF